MDRPRVVLPSASVNGVGSPNSLFSRLNTEPMRAPVNASSPTSQSSAHDLGSAASRCTWFPCLWLAIQGAGTPAT